MKLPLYIIGMLLLIGCKNQSASTQELCEVSGEVWWLEGDFMPRIGEPPPGRRTPAIREVHFFPAINVSDLSGEMGPLFGSIPGQPIAVARSNDNGKFSVMLPAGTYSVFTKESGGFFANSFDGEGLVNPLVVAAGHPSPIVIDINYLATF